METVVVSVGGSILAPDGPDAAYLKRLAAALRGLASTHRLLVVTGGGRTARAYIEAGRALGAPEPFLDGLGIQATRMNARLLMAALGIVANEPIPHSVEEAVEASRSAMIVVMGGTTSGHTTDAVAAELAQAANAARLVNATSVDGVYSADPAKDSTAKRLDRVSYEDLVRLAGAPHARAGPSVVFDPKAARTVAAAKIPVAVVDGRDVEALANAVAGRPFKGTRVG